MRESSYCGFVLKKKIRQRGKSKLVYFAGGKWLLSLKKRRKKRMHLARN
jgi:hypothetical protein